LQAFVVLYALYPLGAQAQGHKYRKAQLLIEPQELSAKLANPELRLVDARPPEEFRAQ
jgi:3-mercaptopyruvate sulfurtransferase SseA